MRRSNNQGRRSKGKAKPWRRSRAGEQNTSLYGVRGYPSSCSRLLSWHALGGGQWIDGLVGAEFVDVARRATLHG